MKEYHKIQGLYKRDENTHKFILGNFSLPEFEYLYHNLWDITEKLDGSNIRVFFDGSALRFGGRTDNAQMPVSVINKLQDLFNVDTMSNNFNINENEESNVCLYGEMIGCFYTNTHILLENNESKTISEIVNKKLNVNVLTYNFKQKKLEFSPILNYFKYPKEKMIKIELDKVRKGGRGRYNQIICTKNHLIYTDKGYVKAKDIIIGDSVMSLQKELSVIQKQVLYGVLMGDGFISIKNNTIVISHSIKQNDYIELFKNLFSNIHLSEGHMLSGHGSEMISLSLTNKELFSEYKNICIVDGKKRLNNNWLNKLTPISLAFWYMDDGSISNTHRKNQRVELATQGFSYEELLLLQDNLYSKYQIRGKLKKVKNKNYFSLILTTEESQLFFIMVAPYMIKLFKYKLPKYLQEMPCVFDYLDPNILCESKTLKPTKIKTITEFDDERNNSVYDIQTKNENFFVSSGLLVHNSKIQKAGSSYIPDGVDFVLFDIRIGHWWLKRDDVNKIAEKLNIKCVPNLGFMTLEQAEHLTREGFKSKIGTCQAEGVVCRPLIDLLSRNGGRVITKIKTIDF